MIEKYID